MGYAVLVLEQPWWNLDEDPGQTSIGHFLGGLSCLEGLPVFQASFYDAHSFFQGLNYLVDARKLKSIDQFIIYIASHGGGSRIGNGNARAMNLQTVFDHIHTVCKNNVVGIVLDSCEIGSRLDLVKVGMRKTKAKWLIAYGAPTDWLMSTLINVRVLSAMTGIARDGLNSKQRLKDCLQKALRLFNPIMEIDDAGGRGMDASDSPLFLSEIMTIAIQPSIKHYKLLEPQDLWPEFF